MASFATIAPYYNRIFPYKPAKGDFIESLLSIKPSYILDIGCATGAMVNDLAKRGHFATGIDLDIEMISIARKDSGNFGAEFEVMDMLQIDEIFGIKQFHLVSCLGNTLVQLDTTEKIASLLVKVKQILKSGGVFLLQNVNYDKIISRNITALPIIENKELIFYRNYYYHRDSGMIEFNTRIIDKSIFKEIKNTTNLYPLRSEELQELLLQAGFMDFEFYGDFEGANFDMESPALIAIVRNEQL